MCRSSWPAPRWSQVLPDMDIDGNFCLSGGLCHSVSAVEPVAEPVLSQHGSEQPWRAGTAASCLALLRQGCLEHVIGNYS